MSATQAPRLRAAVRSLVLIAIALLLILVLLPLVLIAAGTPIVSAA